MKKEKHITRMQSKDMEGWFLAIVRKGVVYREYFSFKKYGKRRALQYAIDTRDLVLALAGLEL